MSNLITIEGTVVGPNSIRYMEKVVNCFVNNMQEAIAPQPLDLSAHMGKVVKVSGTLQGELWGASFEGEVLEDGYQEITGKVMGSNSIERSGSIITCYCHGMTEASYLPLNLYEYMGCTITVSGELYGHELYKADIVSVEGSDMDKKDLQVNIESS